MSGNSAQSPPSAERRRWLARTGQPAAILWVAVGLLLTALTVAVLAVLFAGAWQDRNARLETAETRNHARAETAAEAVGAMIARADATLRDVGFRVSLEMAEPETVPGRLDQAILETTMLDPAVAVITVHGSDGALIAGAPSNRPLPETIRELPLFEDHVIRWVDFRIGVPRAIAGQPDLLVPISRRLDSEDGRLQAIVTAWMRGSVMKEALRPEGLSPASAITLWAPDGMSVLSAWRTAEGEVHAYFDRRPPADLTPTPACLQSEGATTLVRRCGSLQVDLFRLPNSAHSVLQVTDLDRVVAEWTVVRLQPTIVAAVGFTLLMLVLMGALALTGRRLQVSRTSLEDQRNRLNAIVQSAPDGIMTVGPDMVIMDANPAAEAIFGYQEGSLKGAPLSALLPPDRVVSHQSLAKAFLAGQANAPSVLRNRTVEGRRADGEIFPIQIALSRTIVDRVPQTIAVISDLSAQEQARLELADKNRIISGQLHQLREANAAKNRFLSAMSHELRTPLNAIIGFSDLLRTDLDSLLPAERRQEYVGHIHESGEHLLSLINDILDVSRVEERGASLTPEPLDLAQQIKGLSHLMAPIIGKARLHLQIDSAEGLPPAFADERAFKQILMNLISNAAKFTQPGGTVAIDTRVAGDRIRVAVTDTGIGIPPDRIALLGRPFQQVGDHWSGSATGLGLGLALSRMMAEEMGGELIIESEEGAWTRVSVTFPIALSDADSGAIARRA